MGFQDYGAFIFRQNKKLRASIRDKYFQDVKLIKKTKLRLNKDKVFHNSKIDLVEANQSRIEKIFYDELGIICTAIVLTVLFFFYIGAI